MLLRSLKVSKSIFIILMFLKKLATVFLVKGRWHKFKVVVGFVQHWKNTLLSSREVAF
jgi:hypothetical protein